MNPKQAIIGVDESGKGDFFGPLVIASFCATESDRSPLEGLGVRDSKLIAEKKLLGIDEKLRRDYPHEIVIIGPAKYNELHSRIRNLNKLLAWGHARAIENLLEKCPAQAAVSDKFGDPKLIENALFEKGRTIHLEQIVRGESIFQVAAASILARAAFVRQIHALSEKLKMTIPRGAGPQVDTAARELVRTQGADILKEVAKIHFKNYSRVVNPSLF
ncbi:MAG: ribonuclease HIII [Candidatus Zixiibacteriota bacterium]